MKTIPLLAVLASALPLCGAENPDFFRLSKVVGAGATSAVEMRDGGVGGSNTVWVDAAPLLCQTDIARADVVDGDPVRIRFEFTGAGRKKFLEITKQFVGKRIALVAEGRLVSAPRVNEQILGSTVEIAWDRGRDDALRFARRFPRPNAQ